MNILGWIVILLLLGLVFSVFGLGGASSFAFGGAELLGGLLLIFLVLGLILVSVGKK